MKINHDLRHRVTVVEAQGKALIEQKVELEADLQTREQELGSLRAELGRLRERLRGGPSQNGGEEPEVRPGAQEVAVTCRAAGRVRGGQAWGWRPGGRRGLPEPLRQPRACLPGSPGSSWAWALPRAVPRGLGESVDKPR